MPKPGFRGTNQYRHPWYLLLPSGPVGRTFPPLTEEEKAQEAEVYEHVYCRACGMGHRADWQGCRARLGQDKA